MVYNDSRRALCKTTIKTIKGNGGIKILRGEIVAVLRSEYASNVAKFSSTAILNGSVQRLVGVFRKGELGDLQGNVNGAVRNLYQQELPKSVARPSVHVKPAILNMAWRGKVKRTQNGRGGLDHIVQDISASMYQGVDMFSNIDWLWKEYLVAHSYLPSKFTIRG